MQPLTLDPNGLLLATVIGAVAYIFTHMQEPGRRQQKLMMLAMGAGAAYMMRQLEGRNTQGDAQSVMIATIESKFEERFKTVFTDVRDIKETLRDMDERFADMMMAANRSRSRPASRR